MTFRADSLLQIALSGRTPQALRMELGSLFRTDLELVTLYARHGIAARIVDKPAHDAVARGYEIPGDDQGHISDEHQRLGLTAKLVDMIKWCRLFGGSAMIPILKDGGLLKDPVQTAQLQEILELKVFDVTCLTVISWYADPYQANYGQPELYEVRLAGTSPTASAAFQVHESRVLTMGGAAAPSQVARVRPGNVGWRGMSVLDACYESVGRYLRALEWSEKMLERKQQAVYQMKGMATLLQQSLMGPPTPGQGAEAVVRARLDLTDTMRNLLQTIAIDSEDDYVVRDLNLSGVTDILNQLQIAVSADAGMPVTEIFGRPPAGHNATGESDKESYYTLVGQVQDNQVLPIMIGVTDLIMAQTSFAGPRLPKLVIKFHPLWLPTDKDQADAERQRGLGRQARATADDTYVQNNTLTQAEIRQSLIDEGLYSLPGTEPPTQVDEEFHENT